MKRWEVRETIQQVLLALNIIDFDERERKQEAIMKILFEEFE